MSARAGTRAPAIRLGASALVALAAFLPAMSFAAVPLDSASDIGLIEQAIDAGRLLQAEMMLEEWSGRSDASGLAVAERIGAELALAHHRDEEAAARFEALAQKGATGCRVEEGLGIAYLRMGRHGDALAPLLRATATCPERWQGWNALGIAQDFREAWSRSRKAYDRAFALTDRPAVVANNYGFSLLLQRRLPEAARMFVLARREAPDNPRYTNNLDIADALAGRPLKPEAPTGDPDQGEWAERLNNAGYVSLLAGNRAAANAYFSRSLAEGARLSRRAEANLAFMGEKTD